MAKIQQTGTTAGKSHAMRWAVAGVAELRREFVADLDGLLHHHTVSVAALNILNKRFVYFQFCRWNVPQLLHHGVAGSKIVDRQLHLFHPQSG